MKQASSAMIVLTLFIVSSYVQSQSQSQSSMDAGLSQIDQEEIRIHMDFLADDLLEGRGIGTRGYDLAARYVAEQFNVLGLTPAFPGGYFQQVPLRRAIAIEEETAITLSQDDERVHLVYNRDFVTGGDIYREDLSISAPVVFVGFGIVAPEFGYDSYAEVDVSGKIAAFLPGVPSHFPVSQGNYFSALHVRMEEAIRRGAVGILFLTPDELFPWEAAIQLADQGTTNWLKPDDQPALPSRPLAFAVFTYASTQSLFQLASQDFDQIATVLREGQGQSFDLEVTVNLRGRSRHMRFSSPNVAAILRGSDPNFKHEYLVYTAHLDHLGRGQPIDGDAIYNGAIDNAAGVAIVLMMARAFIMDAGRPRRSILFLATTAEESGAVGSDYFTTHSPVSVSDIVAAINIDAPSLLYPIYSVTAMGGEHSNLGLMAEEAAGELDLQIRLAPFVISSDGPSFFRRGVPVLRMITGTETGRSDLDGEQVIREWVLHIYHSPKDDMSQRLNFDSAVKHAQMNFAIGYKIAYELRDPRWKTGDFFGIKFGQGSEE